jgi:hypothetical protein
LAPAGLLLGNIRPFFKLNLKKVLKCLTAHCPQIQVRDFFISASEERKRNSLFLFRPREDETKTWYLLPFVEPLHSSGRSLYFINTRDTKKHF